MGDGTAAGGAGAQAGPGSVAAVDCGTNSTRLLVAGPDGAPLERLMTITRLGEGVDGARRLAPAAIARTVDALRRYRQVMDGLGVGRVRAVATSAARDADNRDELFDAAEAVLGVRPELLTGDEEGTLSYAGATAGLDPSSGPYVVVDVGGGSTELVCPDDRGVPRARSVDVGCVRVTERFLAADPPAPEELARAAAAARHAVGTAARSLAGLHRCRTMIGLAGTVSTAAMVDLGLDSYRREAVHHHVLGRAAVAAICQRLASLDRRARSAVAGIEPGRVDVIVGGLVVLAAAMDELGFDECLVSESDILDGMVASLLGAASTLLK
ncbi:MAG TPA: Ppx/GppA phosphatase family protein [Acidimicrobiales bacterium]|nr:Ppx/GppA phosphatase family protein [Acidimicrobiales bacterium]